MTKPDFFPKLHVIFSYALQYHKHHTASSNKAPKVVAMASKKLASTTRKAKPAEAAVTKKEEAKPAKRAAAAKQKTAKPGQYSMQQDAICPGTKSVPAPAASTTLKTPTLTLL
jgi:hypothetical protein